MKSFLFTITILTALTEIASAARPRDDDGPEAPEPPEPEDPRPPRDEPSEPAPEPGQIPAPIYGRESWLPLCEWGPYTEDRSFQRFLWDEEHQDRGEWTCSAVEDGLPSDKPCMWAGDKPADATYALEPSDVICWYTRDLEWADGSALYATWGMSCASTGASGGAEDIVVESNVVGLTATKELAYVTGGVVEHVRPALVRGSVLIRLPDKFLARQENDLELAIQILGEEGWVDLVTSHHTVEKTLTTFVVEATVPPMLDVRLAIRGEASRGYHGAGYDLRDARLFVEVCIPDQNQPGTCLGD